MRTAIPVVGGLVAAAIVAGLVLGDDHRPMTPTPPTGWTPHLVERPPVHADVPWASDDPTRNPVELLPPATAPADVYPL